ncbi:hypothetical protein [Ruegeria atlantica]|uniref:hypothetical protein n=1 Tax=Ruegeria atlantica TaxID=81569 RepID=UPI00147BE39D|nr:hypothetical protein [Ruegeria atlantica]
MNWGTRTLIGLVAAVSAATTAPAVADSSKFASETVAACQSAIDLVTVTDNLIKIGWTHAVPAELDDRAIKSFAASLLSEQFGYGDVADPRIVRTWELALKNAAGTRNLVTFEGTEQKDRWFVKLQTGSVLRISTDEYNTYSQLRCLIALKDEDSPVTFERLLGGSGRDPATLPPVYRLRSQSYESNGLKRVLNSAVLNTERISTVSDIGIDVSSIFSTYVTKQAENSK